MTFEPDKWITVYDVAPFANRLPDDAFWAARQVVAFTDEDIRAIVKVAQYSDPKAESWIADCLIDRRDRIGRTYFSKVLPLDNIALHGAELTFVDLAVQHQYATPRRYRTEWLTYDNTAGKPSALLGSTTQGQSIPTEAANAPVDSYVMARITAEGVAADMAVSLYLRREPDGLRLVGIDREWPARSLVDPRIVVRPVRNRYVELDTERQRLFDTYARTMNVKLGENMFLIDHAARLLRPVTIVSRIARDGLKVIDDVYPDPVTAGTIGVRFRGELSHSQRTVVHPGKSAVVIAVNLKALVAAAKRTDAVIELVPRVGDFVATNDLLFRQHSGPVAIDARLLHGLVAFGSERTLEQDSTFAFRVIVDIAIKALSPAINDPTTAVIAIDNLQQLLRTVGLRELHNVWVCDEDGRRRVLFRTPDWNDFVQLAFSEIRHCGAGNLQVARRLRAMIESVLETVPESRVPALRQEWELLDRTVQRLYPFPEDVALARIPDPQGLGGASDHDAKSPAE